VLLDPLEIAVVVGDDPQQGTWSGNAVDGAEKRILYEAAFVVPDLGPWIRKIKMDVPDAGIGDVMAKEEVRFCADQSDVRQPVAAATVRSVSPVGTGVFDPEKIRRGFTFRCPYQKGALARTDLDVERAVLIIRVEPSVGIDAALFPWGQVIAKQTDASDVGGVVA